MDPDCYAARALGRSLMSRREQPRRRHPPRQLSATALHDVYAVLMHSADVGLLIRVVGIGGVFGDERVEDELRDGVSFDSRTIAPSVQFSISLLRGIAASDEDADGLIDDRHRPQICPGIRPGWAGQVLIEHEVPGRAAG